MTSGSAAKGRRKGAAQGSGLRAALAAKTVRTAYFDIPIRPSAEADQAGERVTRLKGQLELARLTGKEPEVLERLDEQLTAARADRDACFHRIHFGALSPKEWDAFVNEHQDDDDDRFFYDLLVATIRNGDDMTAEEWRAELDDGDRWPAPDLRRFRRTVYEAQERDFSAGIPKD